MTTLEPGASVVLTHGLRSRPASTAFLASSAAPTITDGFDVFVHDVMAAMTTAPWSISNDEPSRLTGMGLRGRPPLGCTGACGLSSSESPATTESGSLAGKDSADPASIEPFGISSGAYSRSAVRKPALA